MGCPFCYKSKGGKSTSNIRYTLISCQSTNRKKTKSSHNFSSAMAANCIITYYIIIFLL